MAKRPVSKVCLNRICGVCEDKAIGRNFGAITCESCKAFFRRAALKDKILNCSFENKCKIGAKNRKSCKKCRLDKCYAIGMKKELIIKREDSDSKDSIETKDKKFARRRTNTNESNDSLTSFASLYTTDDSFCNPSPNSLVSLSPAPSNSMPTDNEFFGDNFEQLIENFCLNDDAIDMEIKDIENYLLDSKSSVELESKDSADKPNITCSAILPVVRPIATFDKDFNDIELNRLTELKIASDDICVFATDYSNRHNRKSIEFKTIKEMVLWFNSNSIWDQSIESVVKFCRNMSAFKDICETDQLVLFKNSCWDIMSLKHLPFYNTKDESFEYVLNNEYSCRFGMELIRREWGQIYPLCKNFFNNMPDDWRFDTTLINLLIAVSLFNCESSKLSHKPMAKLNQQMYLYLLQRYLLQKFRSEDKSSEKLSKSLNKLMELHDISEKQKHHAKDYAEYYTPLVREALGWSDELT